MNSPRDTPHVNGRPGHSRQNPTVLALWAGLLAIFALLVAIFAFAEERHERRADETVQRVGRAAKDIDQTARAVVDRIIPAKQAQDGATQTHEGLNPE